MALYRELDYCLALAVVAQGRRSLIELDTDKCCLQDARIAAEATLASRMRPKGIEREYG